MRPTTRPNVRLVKSMEVVQVLTAAEQRPATDRKYPLWPHGIFLGVLVSLPFWALGMYLIWCGGRCGR